MLDAADDARVHSLLPVLVVLIAELPAGKVKLFLESFYKMFSVLLLCLVFLGDKVLCGGQSLL